MTRESTATAVLPRTNEAGFYEIRFESIGGLGAHLAGQTLAEAGVLGLGLEGSHFSSYGSEKKGTPLKSFIRFAESGHPVRTSSPVVRPHMVVIFHEGLARSYPVLSGLEPGGIVLVNTHRPADEMAEQLGLTFGTIATVDALRIAIEEKTRINTAMLGAMTRLLEFFDRETIREALTHTFEKRHANLLDANLRTFDRAYEEVHVLDLGGPGEGIPVVTSVPQLGYENAPIGGTITNVGSTIAKDMSTSRGGALPEFVPDACINCGLCDIACPDLCFVWEEGVDEKGRPAMVLSGIDYKYCKGCLKCVEICPSTPPALVEREETEGWAAEHTVAHSWGALEKDAVES
jgi:pyruvate ferredoxin oxidoreductase gamma subunit